MPEEPTTNLAFDSQINRPAVARRSSSRVSNKTTSGRVAEQRGKSFVNLFCLAAQMSRHQKAHIARLFASQNVNGCPPSSIGVTGCFDIIGCRSRRNVSFATVANKFPNTQYRFSSGAPTSSGTKGEAKTFCPISYALPMLPICGEESNVEQIL